ncbi:bacteriorhodopsin [Geodermatophilus sp. DSM 44513]|uniref:bacteriorhodopsin n=1 Tax=Geodermatophilus sp. DSM 44513 TaxID=1528104 RepID=UPI0012734E82|nr:bacteriorhodopsin [Geodermatophilus sp. DSM 44513]WNV74680.1 bacteriorhodopsin [Geodermatophilus sp. DSM 44513]
MENDLVFSPTQHAIVAHAFAVALGAHIVGFLYFLSRKDQIAPRYRTATWLSLAVMAASGFLFLRLGQSWDLAFAQAGADMVRTPNRFDGGLRYVNWFVTVPVLLVQVLYALDLTRSVAQRLRVVLVSSGVLMVFCGWVGQFSAGRDDGTLLLWGLLGTPPFVVLLAALVPRLLGARAYLAPEAATTARNLVFVVVFFWGLYPIAYLLPAFSTSASTAVAVQLLFTAADVGSKVLYGVMLAKLCRLRSAADGHPPALEVATGPGPHPEHERA